MYKLLVDNSGKDVWEDFSVNSTDGFEVDDFNAWPLLKTDILSSGKTYNALVEDVYEDGKEHLMTASMFVAKDFIPEKLVIITMRKHDGGTLSLRGSVKWFLRSLNNSHKMILGIKVIDPPQSYRVIIRDQALSA